VPRSFRCLLLACVFGGTLAAQTVGHYPVDIAARWLTVAQVTENTKASAPLEPGTPAKIIVARPVPFQDVSLARNKSAPVVRKGSWQVPPFPQIGPPSAQQREQVASAQPPVFADVDGEADSPSAYLRPLPAPAKGHVSFRDFVIPEPISSVCFSSGLSGVCQLSLYGGTTSFAAEDAYVALSAALDSKEPLQGFGKEAVLGVFSEEGVKAPIRETGPGFADVPPVGARRPELVDPGLNQARKAPAFRDVSTTLQQNTRLDLSKLPRNTPPQVYRTPRSYWVVLMYFPDKAITAELALDKRLGTPQGLVDMALQVQSRIKEHS
jgi:hypothetical protein